MMKKGVSPIIATILLIIMTVGIAALMYTWMSGMLTQLTAQTGQQILQSTAFDFSVAPVGTTTSGSSIIFTVSIRNTGSVNIDFGRTQVNASVSVYNRTAPEIGIWKQDICTLTTPLQNPLNVGSSMIVNFSCSNVGNITANYYVLRVTMGAVAKEVTFR
ncbi:hypothetical protein BA065_02480 [Nanoarchaeota archaeon NZ13-N]|nr:MAG: hypothetical protein BA065_02480 [Nanoarchaeota archaeon NZ13-N]